MDQKAIYIERLRYRRLAYSVVRDAIGFYFGIPKFFANNDPKKAYKLLLANRLEIFEREKGRKPNDKELERYKRFTQRSINKRIRDLKEDYSECQDVLFSENLWTAQLDLNTEFLKNYLDSMSEEMKDELAVVPKWTTYDYSLGRPYINDNFDLTHPFV